MRVFVTGIEGAASLNTVMLLDALTKSNAAWRALHDRSAPDLFEPLAVGTDHRPIEFANGVRVDPAVVAGGDVRPDLVVVPGLDDNVYSSLERNRHWVPWIAKWAADGTIIASSCTGAFILAEAGILDGRRATTHWVAATLFRARYPNVDLAIDRVVIDEGSAITSGGATTALNLVHYLVFRFGSADRARAATQMMLLDSGRSSQLPFAMIGLHREHDDQVVLEAQSAIQQDLVADLTVAAVAEFVNVTPRTLARRFRDAIGMSPKAYIDEVRIESAKHLLEQTSQPVDRIRADVGFLDPTAFRRAFKRAVGTTPTEHRRRFGATHTRAVG